MREILFRGQQKDGTWLYGDLFGINYHTTNRSWCYINGVGVGKKTVGQYTGLTDKNGKKIFEGDIVKYSIYPPDKFEIREIGYEHGRFDAKGGECALCISSMDGVNEYQLEVIGNIHDNPELLDGSDNGEKV